MDAEEWEENEDEGSAGAMGSIPPGVARVRPGDLPLVRLRFNSSFPPGTNGFGGE